MNQAEYRVRELVWPLEFGVVSPDDEHNRTLLHNEQSNRAASF